MATPSFTFRATKYPLDYSGIGPIGGLRSLEHINCADILSTPEEKQSSLLISSSYGQVEISTLNADKASFEVYTLNGTSIPFSIISKNRIGLKKETLLGKVIILKVKLNGNETIFRKLIMN